MKPTGPKIYLASKSPRRRELLRQIGVDFELLMLRDLPRGPEVSEAVLPGEAAEEYVARVTLEKVQAAHQTMLWRRLPARAILAADTTVTLDTHIMGKPANTAEAADMLKMLSGRTHQVLSSVALHHQGTIWQTTQRSQVTFTPLSADAIASYCAIAEPYDKAGAYGVQGYAAVFIQEIVGSYSGIMGLPLFETGQLLQQAGLRQP